MHDGSGFLTGSETAYADGDNGLQAISLQVKALSRLHELAMSLASMPEPQPALQAILETLAEVHRADFSLLSLYDAASGCLTPSASLGFDAAALAVLAHVLPGPNEGEHGQRRRVEEIGRAHV